MLNSARQWPLWDPGRIAVILGGHLVAYFHNRDEPPAKRITASEVRGDGRVRPRTAAQAVLTSSTRCLAGIYILLAGLGGLILVGVVGALLLGSGNVVSHVLFGALMTLAVFGGWNTVVSGVRSSMARIVGARAFAPAKGSRVLRWLATPSLMEWIPLVLLGMAFARPA